MINSEVNFDSQERHTEYVGDSWAGRRETYLRYFGDKINNFSLGMKWSKRKCLDFRLLHSTKQEKEEEIWGLAYVAVSAQMRTSVQF